MDDLIEAIYSGQAQLVVSLIPGYRDLNQPSRYGTRPLYAAAVQGELAMVRSLLEAGADANAESLGESEGTPLCAAASWGYIDVVRALLDAGADPNLVEKAADIPMTPIAWASRKGHTEIVRLLIESGATPPAGSKSRSPD